MIVESRILQSCPWKCVKLQKWEIEVQLAWQSVPGCAMNG